MEQQSRSNKLRISSVELSCIDVCRAFPPHLLAQIATEFQRVTADAGAEIIAQDDQSNDVYFMISGRVRVNIVATTGRQITYQILEPGQIFGELAALDKLPRTAGVYAEDAVVLARISAEKFEALVVKHPQFALAIMNRLAALARWLTERVFEYHAYDVKGRIYSELLRLCEQGAQLEFKITDRDMASRVGTTRENVTRIYANLKSKGVLDRRPSAIEILDVATLTRLLEECEFG